MLQLASDLSESQLLVALEAYLHRPEMLQAVLNEVYTQYRMVSDEQVVSCAAYAPFASVTSVYRSTQITPKVFASFSPRSRFTSTIDSCKFREPPPCFT